MRFLSQIFMVLMSALLIAGCSGSRANSGKMDQSIDSSIRVMTFNIRYNNPGDGKFAWPNRRDGAVKMLDFHKVDIAGLQEALKGQLDDFLRLAPEFTSVGVGRTDGKEAGEYSPILFRKDKFKLVDWGTFWLSETPDVVGSRGWDAALERICTWAKLKEKTSGKEFVVMNTHFDHMGEVARVKSAELIVKKLNEYPADTPLVLMGDFNSTPDSKAIQAVLTPGAKHTMQNTRTLAGKRAYGPEGTFTGFTVEQKGLNTIDFIFVNKHFSVERQGVISELWDDLIPSDHRPVLAELDF